MQKTRFTLRKENMTYADGRPCGGILHDAENLTCYTLSPSLYQYLAGMEKCRKVADKQNRVQSSRNLSDDDRAQFLKLVDKGVALISDFGSPLVDSARVVENKILPAHCLSMPLRVYHTITRRCNLACPQCLVASYSNFPEDRMSAWQAKDLIAHCYDLGVPEWRFTGGEPTFCEDFFEIADYARNEVGMSLMLNSNGCWDDQIFDSVLGIGFSEIIISLEGNERINDQRRSAGSYRKIVWTLDQLAAFNQSFPDLAPRVTINMTVARDNFSDIEYVIRFAAARKFNTNFVPLRPYGRSLDGLKDQMLSTEEFMNLGKLTQRLRDDPEISKSGIRVLHKNMDLFCPDYPDRSSEPWPFSYGDCGALTTGWGIGPDGKANACSFLMNDPYFVSDRSLLGDDIQSVWLGEKMEYFRNAKKITCNAGCKFYHKQCEGMCRAMVLANGGKIESGKLIGRDPYCFRRLMTKE